MKKTIVGVLLLLSTIANAGPYVEIGASIIDGCLTDYDEKRKMNGCSDNPFGLLAVGYEYNGFAIEAEHRSSLVEKDPGFNALTVKYRWEWK